jgi:hypothetical protein
MSKKEISANYDKRIKEMKLTTEEGSTESVGGKPREETIQSRTSKYLAPKVCDSKFWCTTLYPMLLTW